MNRRTFLKSLGIICGAAVVCPGELLKAPVIPVTIFIDKSKGWVCGERSKHIFFMGQRLHYNEILAAYEGEYY